MKAHHFVHLTSTLVALLYAFVASAASEVDPSVTYVATEGYWEHSGQRGTFRVVVSAGGFEHIATTVVAEWIAEPRDQDDSTRVLISRDLLRNSMVAIGPPILKIYPNRVRVTLNSVFTHLPDKEVSCAFDLLGEGTVRVVKACS